MTYIKQKPAQPSFSQKGFAGYTFPLKNNNVQISFIDSTQGHDNFVISKETTYCYYILEGSGYFEINGAKYSVKPSDLIEVPPKAEFAYSGKMKLLLIMNPPWFEGSAEVVKRNEEVK